MSEAEARTVDAVAAAVLAVPGVVCLQPGLADLVRYPAPRTETVGGAASVRPGAGLRLGEPDASGWRVGVRIVLRRGVQVLPVTRAVRAAVRAATGREHPRAPEPHVSVTVTGFL